MSALTAAYAEVSQLYTDEIDDALVNVHVAVEISTTSAYVTDDSVNQVLDSRAVLEVLKPLTTALKALHRELSPVWIRPWAGRYSEQDLAQLTDWAGKRPGGRERLAEARDRYVDALGRHASGLVPAPGSGTSLPSPASLLTIAEHWERQEAKGKGRADGGASARPPIDDLLLDRIALDLGIDRKDLQTGTPEPSVVRSGTLRGGLSEDPPDVPPGRRRDGPAECGGCAAVPGYEAAGGDRVVDRR